MADSANGSVARKIVSDLAGFVGLVIFASLVLLALIAAFQPGDEATMKIAAVTYAVVVGLPVIVILFFRHVRS